MRKSVLIAGVMVSAAVLSGVRVYADDAAGIETDYPLGSYVTYDNTAGLDANGYPVITAVASKPGVTAGHNYTGWSVLAEDQSGSLDLFVSASTLTTLQANASATLAAGDGVNVGGVYSPYDAIPEMTFASTPNATNYLQTVSTGNALPTAPVFTVSQLLGYTNPATNGNMAGYYLEIQNAVVSNTNGLTSFPGYTSNTTLETMKLTDNTGSMTLFDWTTSYSGAAALTGTPIGVTCDIYGFVDYFAPNAEFVPLSITVVPEPSTIMLAGVGLIGGLLAIRRRRA